MKTILTLALSMLAAAALAQTTISPVNVGTTPNDHTGDPLRTAMQKINLSESNLLAGKMEATNPVVKGGFGSVDFTPIGFPDYGIKIGVSKITSTTQIITGPTHGWTTLDIDPGATTSNPGPLSAVNIHGFLTASNYADSTGYEWQHVDGSFSLDKSGANVIKGTFTGGFNSDWTNGPNNTIRLDGSGFFSGNGFNWDASGNVSAGGYISAGTELRIGGGSTKLSPLFLSLAGANMTLSSQTLFSPVRGWHQINFTIPFFVNGPTNNFFQFDAPVYLFSASDYAGYEWLHQDGSVSFDKSGTTNHFAGTFSGSVAASSATANSLTVSNAISATTNTANILYLSTVGGATSWGTGTVYTNGPWRAIFRMDISSTSGGSGSPNQVFFHYTNNAVGRQRQAFFTLSSGAVNVQPMIVELGPNATFKIDTITSTGGSFSFLNQTLTDY